MNLEKINDIWLPVNLEQELHTEDMKVWFKYCKLQTKKFSHVIDIVGEYCIWARSMRFYSKKISSYQTDSKFIPAWIKNCERYNNISYFQNTFALNFVTDQTELVRVPFDMLDKIHNKNIPFIYVCNSTIEKLPNYKRLFIGKKDTVLYHANR